MSPPYDPIAKGLAAGNVICVLGAGASIADRASGNWLLSGSLPTAEELARELEKRLGIPPEVYQARGLAGVGSAAKRNDLEDALRDIFLNRGKPWDLHTLLAGTCPRIVITTNYDTLLERSFSEDTFQVVAYRGDCKDDQTLWVKDGATAAVLRPQHYQARENRTVIFKIHGSSHEGCGFVLSEKDYETILLDFTRGRVIPRSFYRYFWRKRFLFLGYGLEDWSLRLAFRQLRRTRLYTGRDDMEWWSIVYEQDPEKLQIHQRLWDREDIRVCNVPLRQFIDELKRHLQ
jgi:hypothetical protein